MKRTKPKRAKRCRHEAAGDLCVVPELGGHALHSPRKSGAEWCPTCGALKLDGKWRLPENAGGRK